MYITSKGIIDLIPFFIEKVHPMKPILVFTIVLVLISNRAYPRSNTAPIGSKSMALANATVAQIHLESIFNNQAALAYIDQFQLGIFYDNRFLVDALSTKAIAISLPTQIGTVGMQFNTFGNPRWLENNLGIAYSRLLNPSIAASVGFNYYSTRVPETNELVKQIGANLGVVYRYSSNAKIGLSLNHFGVSNQSSSTINSEIPWSLNLGGSSKLNNNTNVYYQIQKIEAQNLQLMGALDWALVENFNLRFGLSSSANHLTSGIAYTYSNFEFNLAFVFNQYLGFSPSASIVFTKNKAR